MKKPKISVIIPCYNLGQFVGEAVDSILAQTRKDFEIIIVDDESKDQETHKVLKEIEKRGIKVIFQKNTGLPGARNTGIKASQGEYIICLDADDKLKKEYLEETTAIFEADKKKEIGIVTTWIQSFGASDEVWEPIEYDPIALMIKNVLSVASIFRKECWEEAGGYNTNMVGGYEDWDYWLSIVERGYRWEVVNKALFYYRRRPNSMIKDSIKIHGNLYGRILNNHKKFYEENFEALVLRYAEKVNYLEQLIESNPKGIVGKIAVRPSMLFEPKNYARLVNRVINKVKNAKDI